MGTAKLQGVSHHALIKNETDFKNWGMFSKGGMGALWPWEHIKTYIVGISAL